MTQSKEWFRGFFIYKIKRYENLENDNSFDIIFDTKFLNKNQVKFEYISKFNKIWN